jgi:WD40 repeat protein
MSSDHPASEILADLLLEWEERRERGEKSTPEDLCRDHPECLEPLRARIAALQAMSPLLSTRLSLPASASTAKAGPLKLPELLGYELLGELGRGGMGVVYKARHLALKRLVALKMIRTPGAASAEEIARFRTEAEAVARLRHPHIVQIHDVGEHDGSPYFALEFLAGGSLDRHLRGSPLPPRAAAQLMESLALAMHSAHEQGIVHRDLKPGNVLLETAPVDAEGAPEFPSVHAKVTDFGIAKFFGEQEGAQTASGSILGTPSYMAPEQANGQIREIGPATDVYALGAILYELLTGRAPFRADTSWDTIAQVIGQEPIPPSRFHAKIPPDLETICLRCLEKKPSARYRSAKALAEDLRRYLDDMPIFARPAGTLERLGKWARRRPAVAGLLASVVVGAVGVLTLGILWSLDLRAANKAIGDERDIAKNAEAVAKKQHATARLRLNDLQLAFVKMVHEKEPSRGLALLEDTQNCPEDLRDFSWRMYRSLCKRDRILKTFGKDVKTAVFAKGGTMLIAADAVGTSAAFDVKTGADTAIGGMPAVAQFLASSETGEVLFAGDSEGTIHRISMEGKDTASVLARLPSLSALACSRDGSLLVAGTRDGKVFLQELAAGIRVPKTLAKDLGGIASIAVSHDAARIAVACERGIRLFDSATGEEREAPKMRGLAVTAVAFSSDGLRLIACNADGATQWWNAGDPQPQGRFDVPRTMIWSLAAAPDGRGFAIAGMDGVIRCIDFATEKEMLVLSGHSGAVWRLEYSPDGESLASVGADGSVRLWSVASPAKGRLLETKGTFLSAAFSADGAVLATGTRSGRLTLWDPASAKQIAGFATKRGPVTGIRASGSGTWICGHGSGNVSIQSRDGAEELHCIEAANGPVLSLAFAPLADRLFLSGKDGTFACWNLETRAEMWKRSLGDVLWTIDSTADGKQIAVGSSNGKAWLYDAEGQLLFEFPARKLSIISVAFSPDGKSLAIAGQDNAIEIWDLSTRVRSRMLTGPRNSLRSIAFATEGRTLASVGDDGEVRLWDLVTGQERLRLPLPTLSGNGVVFAPNGHGLAAFGETKAVVWQP